MIITFDLDGTICDSDWDWLDRLRERAWPKDEEEKYYACREKILDPYNFIGVDDVGIILTGRPIHTMAITERWLLKNGLSHLQLVFTKTLKDYPTATREEFKKIGIDKASFFVNNKVQVHFDDNEQVVDAMRKTFPNIVVIHVGHHVVW